MSEGWARDRESHVEDVTTARNPVNARATDEEERRDVQERFQCCPVDDLEPETRHDHGEQEVHFLPGRLSLDQRLSHDVVGQLGWRIRPLASDTR